MLEALGLTPTTAQSGCGGAHLYSQAIEVGGSRSEVQGYPPVRRKLQASVGNEWPSLKINKHVSGCNKDR